MERNPIYNIRCINYARPSLMEGSKSAGWMRGRGDEITAPRPEMLCRAGREPNTMTHPPPRWSAAKPLILHASAKALGFLRKNLLIFCSHFPFKQQCFGYQVRHCNNEWSAQEYMCKGVCAWMWKTGHLIFIIKALKIFESIYVGD